CEASPSAASRSTPPRWESATPAPADASRHCEERSDEAIQFRLRGRSGLLRFARNDDFKARFALQRSTTAPNVGACFDNMNFSRK
ncbi:MAG: hypothetical protein ACXWUV_17020, partial [Allosphingosinicella sp.]